MSILSDKDIKKLIKEDKLIISYVNDRDIQPASVDLHLGCALINLDGEIFNLKEDDYLLQPNEFILGSTREYVKIPNDLVAQVDGKSSIGRLGVLIHVTAGFIDSGFEGNITLEIKNISNKPFLLSNDMSICQIIFFTLSSPCLRSYGDEELQSKYQKSKGTILSRYQYDS